MADFSGAPVSDAYYQRVDANNQQSARNLQSLAQMMTLQRQQQEMAQAPEDRMLKRRLIESQIGEQDFKMAQSRIAQAKEAEKQALISEWSALPDTDPRKPMLQQKLRVLIDPGNALDPAKTSNLPWYVQRGPDGKTRIDPAYQEFEAMKASKGGTKVNMPAAVTPVTIQDPNNPNATIIIDGRTRQVLGAGPKMTETGKANYKQAQTMQGLGSDLQRAEDLLMGQVRDSEGNVTKGNLPTGSGIGSLYDAAAGFVGASPTGAAEADALRTVAGRLVQKVPRFEGPQSDKDVALYKQMAADAGNDKIPRERRLMAVQKMREIYQGYEDGSKGRLLQEQFATGGQSSGGKIGVPKNRTDIRSQADRILGL